MKGLVPDTHYEWRMQTLCSDGGLSDLSDIHTFTTLTFIPVVTVKSGSWTDPSVWSTNLVPDETDDVEIRHVVSLPNGTVGKAKLLRYSTWGKLNIDSSAQLKINLE